MKKILSIIILPFIFSLNIVHAQYLGYSKLLFSTNDSVNLFASALFGIGDMNCCPPLNSYYMQIQVDTMHVKLFYESVGCVSGFCTTSDFIYLGQILPNTLKAVKLHPYDVGQVAPNVWDTTSYVQYDTVFTFPWSGIDEINSHYFSISPNPTQEECTIEYTLPGEAILTDITGRRLSNYTLHAGKNKETINISSLANGIYLVQYKRSDGMIATQKIVKQ